jgi:hypothetical protein
MATNTELYIGQQLLTSDVGHLKGVCHEIFWVLFWYSMYG